ncbi:uncharacterized protein DUF4190 [Actinoplanes italicus]|uniref:Uncharacterized protein DUF4190 n=1 Tax=Actinoplanes italicus TaxID=113567 RepID=A0A2T0JEP2_9ACTN|nr:uncharacterized protein DUF4190 [Actinoplanes italicus]
MLFSCRSAAPFHVACQEISLSYPPHHGHYRSQPPVVPGQPAPQYRQHGYPPPQSAPPPPPMMMQPPMVVAVAPTSGLAVTSLVFGLIGFFGGFCFFGIPCAIAVVLGHLAIRETRSGERGGHGMAIAGLILGYFLIIPAIIVIAMGGFGAVLGSVSP